MLTQESKRITRALWLAPLLLAAGAHQASAQCSLTIAGSGGGGPASASGVNVEGNIACTVGTHAMTIADVSNPTSPVLLGSIGITNAFNVDIEGTVAYVTTFTTGDLVAVDISTPSSPTILGSVAIGTCEGVQVVGSTAYVAVTASGLQIVDVSNPAAMVALGGVLTSHASVNVSVSGTVACVTTNGGDLHVIDVSNPAAPVVAGTINCGSGSWDVVATGTLAYASAYNGDFCVVDISTPASPTALGSVAAPVGSAETEIALAGSTVYLTGSDQLWSIDVSNPASPVVVDTLTVPTLTRDVAASGGYVYRVGLSGGDLTVVDDVCPSGELALSIADCQDDADPSAGYQIAVELDMLNLSGTDASGYAAFVTYDTGEFTYRGDLSTYTPSPFSQHIGPINQTSDGKLELDGSIVAGGTPTSADALLATLYFDVLTPSCAPVTPIAFETGGAFESKLSLAGSPIDTTLTDPGAYTLDDTNPVFDPFSNITVAADADAVDGCLGAGVTFTDPTATDNCSAPVVTSVPASGSFFGLGTTTVTSTAVDDCGNFTDLMWDVTVTATNVFDIEVELVGVSDPVTRCIRLAGDNCSYGDFSLSFIDHDANAGTPVRAVTSVELDCGQYLSLFAKDEQHTQWASSTVSDTGATWATDAVISLEGGDTDNDSDVDIDDVTLFLAQFGTGPFPSATCPWDGTRDTDFSNNGAIAAEDYVFLTSNWLTITAGPCVLPVSGGGNGNGAANGNGVLQAELRSQTPTNKANRAADLNRDGWIDWLDVKVFERRHGLPELLSAKMRDR